MKNRTQKLLNTKKMTVKETNLEALALYSLYQTYFEDLQAQLEAQWEKTEKVTDEYLEIGYKLDAINDIELVLIDLGYAYRRTRKMLVRLENAIIKAEKRGVIIF